VIVKQVLDKEGKKRVVRTIRPSIGDPRFLDQYQQALERMAVILSLRRAQGPD